MHITYSSSISWQTYFDNTYVFNESTGKVYSLSGTAQSLWLALQNVTSFSMAIDLVSQQYPSVSRLQLETDMLSFVKSLQEKRLVDVRVEG